LGGRVGAGVDSGACGRHEAHAVRRRAAARSDGRLRTEPLPAYGYGEQSRVLMASAAPAPAYGYGEQSRVLMANSQSAPRLTLHEHGHRDGRAAPPSLHTDAASAHRAHAHGPSGSFANARTAVLPRIL
jgi:hypothetical protein